MRKAIATVSLSGSLVQKLDAIARAGFTAVEVFDQDLADFAGSAKDLRRLTDALDLEVVMLQPLRNADGVPPARRARVMEQARRMFDDMNQLGCRQLLACSSVADDALASAQAQEEDLYRLATLAAEFDCQVGYEALAWGDQVNHLTQAWDRVRTVDHTNLGLVLDSFHLLSLGDSVDCLAAIPAEKVFYLQMADAGPRQPENLPVDQWSRHHRCFPGKGQLDTVAFARAVQAIGYQGIWSLEIFNDRYQQSDADYVAAEGFASLKWLEQQLLPA